jgi:GDPmannose 4,6-dehydratase
MKKKIALITGITGQDGAYLAEFLLKKNYIVHGIKRRASTTNNYRIDQLYNTYFENLTKPLFFLHYGDVTDSLNLANIISRVKPDEIYNLAAQSHVKVSFETPEYTANADGLGVLRILEIIKNQKKKIRFYQASTSEMFGSAKPPQNEKTNFKPVSPYGAAKLYGHWITRIYRESYGLFACSGILFNHESPLRGETFVTKKVTKAVGSYFRGNKKILELGNLDAKRDWGHSKEYVKSMWKILQQKKPDDFVISTNKSYSVRFFVEEAYKNIGVKIKWIGKGANEIGVDNKTNKTIISINKKYFRPNEVDYLKGDSSKAKKELKWKPKISFKRLVKEMVRYEIDT